MLVRRGPANRRRCAHRHRQRRRRWRRRHAIRGSPLSVMRRAPSSRRRMAQLDVGIGARHLGHHRRRRRDEDDLVRPARPDEGRCPTPFQLAPSSRTMTRPPRRALPLHHLLGRPDIAALDAGQGVMLRQGALEAVCRPAASPVARMTSSAPKALMSSASNERVEPDRRPAASSAGARTSRGNRGSGRGAAACRRGGTGRRAGRDGLDQRDAVAALGGDPRRFEAGDAAADHQHASWAAPPA